MKLNSNIQYFKNGKVIIRKGQYGLITQRGVTEIVEGKKQKYGFNTTYTATSDMNIDGQSIKKGDKFKIVKDEHP